jgi:hypothetical protein
MIPRKAAKRYAGAADIFEGDPFANMLMILYDDDYGCEDDWKKIELNYHQPFYSVHGGRVHEDAPGSGISMQGACDMQENMPLFETWGQAQEWANNNPAEIISVYQSPAVFNELDCRYPSRQGSTPFYHVSGERLFEIRKQDGSIEKEATLAHWVVSNEAFKSKNDSKVDAEVASPEVVSPEADFTMGLG